MTQTQPNMISPNDLNRAAQAHMLEGREPKTERDWGLVVNFWAANVSDGLEEPTCKIMSMLYQCPLSDGDVQRIAAFQAERK